MNLDLKSVELFIRIAALGAIGKAGDELGLSPTTASQRIQALEDVIGSRSLVRTTRSVTLSAEGGVFLAHAKKILADVEDAVSDLQGDNKILKGELRVTASASFGRRHIAPFVGEFLDEHPELLIHLELSDGIFDIVQHGYDLAIRIGTLAPSTLKARKIAASPRLLVASPAYLLKNGTPQLPKDLTNHNCLALGENRGWTLNDVRGSATEIKVSGNFTTNYGEAVTEAAAAGQGIALKSNWDVIGHITEGTLLTVLPDYRVEPEWNVWAVRPPSRIIPPKVRLFTEFIEQKLNTQNSIGQCPFLQK